MKCRFPILLAAVTLMVVGRSQAAAKPNIVVFLADDLSWADCSIYGQNLGARTPNMERIAADGMTLSHAFVASPSCAPSRAALLTGLWPQRNGSMYNHTTPGKSIKRWPAFFKEQGYETAAIGKVAHYATVQEYGFDFVSHFNYHQDDCIEFAIDWLNKRKSDKPLCLLVGTNWPHVPWPTKSDYSPNELKLPPTQVDTPETREYRARYSTAVSYADRDLGMVYDAARKKLGDDTFFLFSSDHGSQFPFGKWNCYDGGLKTPMLAVWSGKIKPASKSDAMVSWIDILPTCLEVTGGKVPAVGDAGTAISGQSFLPVLTGQKSALRDQIFATHSGDGSMNEFPMRSICTHDWKYVRNLTPEAEYHTHVDKAKADDGGGYWTSWEEKAKTDPAAAKVVARYLRRPAEELYDLKNDPWELTNLATDPAHAAKLKELSGQLDAWMKQQGDKGLATEMAHKPAPKAPAKEGDSKAKADPKGKAKGKAKAKGK